MNDPDRAEFEAHFSKPPFEWNFKRRGEESAWPGSYLNLEHEYAWQGFKMALEWERGRATPEGWQLVPKDPTEEMVEAMHQRISMQYNQANIAQRYQAKHAYADMLAAAPQPVIRNSRNTEGDNHE